MRLPAGTPIRALSVHASYACAHSGACCRSGWPIPIERERVQTLGDAITGGRVCVGMGPVDGGRGRRARVETRALLVVHADAPADTPALAETHADGTCVFYERERRRCAIHRQLGEPALPDTCRQFPRISLLDSRGLSVSLSHYCPTAAWQLVRDALPLCVMDAPPAFPADFPFDPLDARSAFPPLLKPGVLLDLETFDGWERAAVDAFAQDGATPEGAIEQIRKLTEALRTWRPGTTGLARHFDETCNRIGNGARIGNEPLSRFGPRSRFDYALVIAAIPEDLRPAVPLQLVAPAWEQWAEDAWASFAAPVCRYLAAKAFGSWLAYQGRGLRTIVHSLAVALSVLQANAALECHRASARLDETLLVGAIRRTDELLVHLASREDLAQALGAIEALPGASP